MNDNKSMKDIYLALDIGTTKVCAIASKTNEHNKIEILGFGNVLSEGVLRGVVSNIEKTVNAIQEAVRIAEEQSGIKFRKVNVGIAGQHIRSYHHRGILTRDNPMSMITQADIDKLISDMGKLVLPPGDKILHVLPQEYMVDNEQGITDPKGMSGVRLEANFHIITSQQAAYNNIVRCVEKAGLEIASITLEPIASSEAVLSEEEKEAGIALVDIGGGTTDLTIFKNGIIRHTAVIPFGGNIITKDIKEGCTIMEGQAEKLKVKYGSAMPEEITQGLTIAIPGIRGHEPREVSEVVLARIIQARVEEIMDYVMWEVKRSDHERGLIGGVVLTGGGALLRNIKKCVALHTGYNVRIGTPAESLAQGYRVEIGSPKFATSIGLLIKGVPQAVEGIHVEDLEPLGEEVVGGHIPYDDSKDEDQPYKKPDKTKFSWWEELRESTKTWFTDVDDKEIK